MGRGNGKMLSVPRYKKYLTVNQILLGSTECKLWGSTVPFFTSFEIKYAVQLFATLLQKRKRKTMTKQIRSWDATAYNAATQNLKRRNKPGAHVAHFWGSAECKLWGQSYPFPFRSRLVITLKLRHYIVAKKEKHEKTNTSVECHRIPSRNCRN